MAIGKQRVYGKKTVRTYSKFLVDSSENEISDNSCLSHITVDCQSPIRPRLPAHKGQSPILARANPAFTKAHRPLQAPANGPSQTQTDTYHQKHEDSVAHEIGHEDSIFYEIKHEISVTREIERDEPVVHETVLTESYSPSRYLLKNQMYHEKSSYPTKTAHHEAKTSTTDDLSTMLAALELITPPETPTLISQPPPSSTNTDPKFISPTEKSYLSPILCCKNVTPDVFEFSSWMATRTHLALEKIAEGSFGEVFRATSANGDTVVLKLMPLNAMKGRGSKSFTSIDSAANEVRLLERMQRVPGFVEFRGACILIGGLPETLIDLWKKYKSSGRTVESRDPSKKTSYPTDQLWLLIEMSDAGHSLEPGQYTPPGETFVKGQPYLGIGRAWDIFWEVARGVAKAECWVQFEHRDLHMGNICARDTTNAPDEEDLTLVSSSKPTPLPINTSKLEITIIDYSLSRAYMENENNVLYYGFMKDKQILNGEGDLQYDMYRYMAAAVGDRSCKEFVPQTNVVWLWYVLNRILAMTKPLSTKAKVKKQDLITREARKLNILTKVQDLINPEEMVNWTIDSATTLLAIGIEESWLSADDVTN